MNYPVVWRTEALDALADLYVAATPAERERMASGVEALNRRLADEPFEEGESRDGTARVVFLPHLMVRFRFDVATRSVRVTAVTRYGR